MTHTKALLRAAISMGISATNQTLENKKKIVQNVPGEAESGTRSHQNAFGRQHEEVIITCQNRVEKAKALRNQVKPRVMSKRPLTRHGVYSRQKNKKVFPTYKFDQQELKAVPDENTTQ